jgi:hypothetical protein
MEERKEACSQTHSRGGDNVDSGIGLSYRPASLHRLVSESEWIRVQSNEWIRIQIRIQEGKNDPRKNRKKLRNFMF